MKKITKSTPVKTHSMELRASSSKTSTETSDPKSPRRSERLQVTKAIQASKIATQPSRITKPSRFRRPKQSARCRFLRLPGELRNQIFRAVLLPREHDQHQHIRIRPRHGPAEPGLLRVCRGIRADARDIYYCENVFQLEVVGFDGAALLPFMQQYERSAAAALHNVRMSLRGPPSWPNLVRWIRANHVDLTFPLVPEMRPCAGHVDFVLCGAMDLALALQGQPWATVETALEALLTTLQGTCSGLWVK